MRNERYVRMKETKMYLMKIVALWDVWYILTDVSEQLTTSIIGATKGARGKVVYR
jgi:hypothetical protein